jgi:hypothetical protein
VLVLSILLLMELLAAAAAAADLELLLVPLCWATGLRLYRLSTAPLCDLPPGLLCLASHASAVVVGAQAVVPHMVSSDRETAQLATAAIRQLLQDDIQVSWCVEHME